MVSFCSSYFPKSDCVVTYEREKKKRETETEKEREKKRRKKGVENPSDVQRMRSSKNIPFCDTSSKDFFNTFSIFLFI